MTEMETYNWHEILATQRTMKERYLYLCLQSKPTVAIFSFPGSTPCTVWAKPVSMVIQGRNLTRETQKHLNFVFTNDNFLVISLTGSADTEVSLNVQCVRFGSI